MPPNPDAGAKPSRVRVRMYRVGFGDCFLLSFEYPAPLHDGRSVRHVLIDFGSTSASSGTTLERIAEEIKAHSNGELDVVVVSHRHKDHLEAFGRRKLTDALVAPGFPRLVVRSWTEDPDARRNARQPPGGHGIAPVGDKSAAFVETLERAERAIKRLAERVPAAELRSLAGVLHHVANDQLKNRDAVERLASWGEAGDQAYLHYGMPSKIESFVPGISVRVLGPPTVEQHEDITSQRSRDMDEFWMIYRNLFESFEKVDLEEPAPTDRDADAVDQEPTPESESEPETEAPPVPAGFGEPGPVRWLTDSLSRQRLNSLLRIVRTLDSAMNNTSLILLIDVPGVERQRLLFPGDAQIENWEYALKKADHFEKNLDLLREVDLYKVGHHGSRNATPRTLFNLWTEAGTKDRPMTAMMSTKGGVHGESVATAVPRATLKAALDTRMKLHSTQSLGSKKPWLEVAADLTAPGGFKRVED